MARAGTVEVVLSGDMAGLEAALRRSEKSMERTAARLRSIGANLSLGVTAPLVGIGFAAMRSAGETEDALSMMRSMTGATGAHFMELERSMRHVDAQVADSTESVAQVVGTLNRDLGVTGPLLDKLSKHTLDYARANRTAAGPAVATATRLLNALEVEAAELPAVLDKITLASQRSGIEVNELANLVIEAGPAFEEMGFGLDRAIGLFARFHKEGANPREVLSSLNIVLTQLADEGFTDAEAAFRELLQRISDAPGILQATSIAAEAFGARVGAKVAEDIRSGKFEVDEWVEALQGAEGTVARTAEKAETFRERMARLRKEITASLEPLGRGLQDALETSLPLLRTGVALLTAMIGLFTSMPSQIQSMIIASGALVAALGPALVVISGAAKALGAMSSMAAGAAASLTGLGGLLKAGGLIFSIRSFADAVTMARWAVAGLGTTVAVGAPVMVGLGLLAALLVRARLEAQRVAQAFEATKRSVVESVQGMSEAQARATLLQSTSAMAATGARLEEIQARIAEERKRLDTSAAALGTGARPGTISSTLLRELQAEERQLKTTIELHEQAAVAASRRLDETIRARQAMTAPDGAPIGVDPVIAEETEERTDRIAQAHENLARALNTAAGMEQLLGEAFDKNRAVVAAYRSSIQTLLDEGVDPADERIREYAEALLEAESAMLDGMAAHEDYARSMEELGSVAEETTRDLAQLMAEQGVLAGEALMRGILSGARNMRDILKSALINLAVSYVMGPVKMALGIASPSKVFQGYGEAIGEGLALGIESSIGRVASASERMVLAANAPSLRSVYSLATPSPNTAQVVGAGARPMLDPTRLPRPMGPMQSARDGDWLRWLSESMQELEVAGYREYRR